MDNRWNNPLFLWPCSIAFCESLPDGTTDDIIIFCQCLAAVPIREIRGLAFGYLGHGLHPLRNVRPKGSDESHGRHFGQCLNLSSLILSLMLKLFPETKDTTVIEQGPC